MTNGSDKEIGVDMSIKAATKYMAEHAAGVGKRYPERVREAIGKAIKAGRAAGETWVALANKFGLPLLTTRKWGIAAGAPFTPSPEKRPGGAKTGGNVKRAAKVGK